MSLVLFGCQSKNEIKGNWELSLKLQDQVLPIIVQFELDPNIKNKLVGTLINSKESIPLEGFIQKDHFEVSIGTNYAKLVGEIAGSSLEGEWVRTNKEDYKVPFTGKRTSKLKLFSKYEEKKTLLKIDGKWKVELDENRFGLGNFKQVGSRVEGSILTETGDYRFLEGYIQQNTVMLYGFDGTFSFIFKIILSKDRFSAHMYSGKTYNKQIVAVRDDSFKLADPEQLTNLIKNTVLISKFNDISGQALDLNAGRLKSKAKIIQVFGSWCPNCIDETKFFVNWRRKNLAKLNDVEFIALAFEKFPDEKSALKKLRKVRHKLKMDYPLVLADFKSTETVPRFLPIEKTVAFPTTFFLNRKNEIVKVHTGFSGQATDDYFESFKGKFSKIVDELISSGF